jgi:hypothetical protein
LNVVVLAIVSQAEIKNFKLSETRNLDEVHKVGISRQKELPHVSAEFDESLGSGIAQVRDLQFLNVEEPGRMKGHALIKLVDKVPSFLGIAAPFR